MIILKVNDLPESLRFKRSEWGSAAAMAGFGWVLAQPFNTFAANPSFVILHRWAAEEKWAAVTLIIGLASLATMIYNGNWRQYPRARVILAGIRALIWGFIAWGIMRNGIASPGVALFGAFTVMDLHAVYTAAYDAKIIEEDRERNGGP